MEHQEDWPVWATEAVTIVDADPGWHDKGIQEANELGLLLSSYGVSQIEHIGSTSIPGLAAKPIIDLMAKIHSYEQLPQIIDRLAEHRWSFVSPELDGRSYRRFFVKVKDDRRECHLHLMLDDESRWDKQIIFRNRLRERPELTAQYAELKKSLAAANRDDRESYTTAKSEFIRRVLDE